MEEQQGSLKENKREKIEKKIKERKKKKRRKTKIRKKKEKFFSVIEKNHKNI